MHLLDGLQGVEQFERREPRVQRSHGVQKVRTDRLDRRAAPNAGQRDDLGCAQGCEPAHCLGQRCGRVGAEVGAQADVGPSPHSPLATGAAAPSPPPPGLRRRRRRLRAGASASTSASATSYLSWSGAADRGVRTARGCRCCALRASASRAWRSSSLPSAKSSHQSASAESTSPTSARNLRKSKPAR
mmetsp:Transcript_16247/g.45360  ORF Transcript_16247/g.45360 Transcript_16247/m.45360 type:complete len:187 (-) Transcript_16247:815-1375(-)